MVAQGLAESWPVVCGVFWSLRLALLFVNRRHYLRLEMEFERSLFSFKHFSVHPKVQAFFRTKLRVMHGVADFSSTPFPTPCGLSLRVARSGLAGSVLHVFDSVLSRSENRDKNLEATTQIYEAIAIFVGMRSATRCLHFVGHLQDLAVYQVLSSKSIKTVLFSLEA